MSFPYSQQTDKQNLSPSMIRLAYLKYSHNDDSGVTCILSQLLTYVSITGEG